MPERDDIEVLVPRSMEPRLERTATLVEAAAGRALTRGEALGIGGLALLAAATGGAATASAAATVSAAEPLEDKLAVYNWAGYEDPKSVKAFRSAHRATKVSMTFYGGNAELIAKLNQGGSYDVVVPSQNAVAQLAQTGKLMRLDRKLLPNYKYYDPTWRHPVYDPQGLYSVVHSYGLTGFIYRNDIVTERPKTLLEFYNLLEKYSSKGRTSILDGADNVVPLALMALGLDGNTKDPAKLAKAKKLLLRIRPHVSNITAANLVADAAAGKVLLQQTYNGSAILTLAEAKKQGHDYLTWVLPQGSSQRWSDNWAIPANAPHPVAAHAWINHFLNPAVAAQTMAFSGYPTPVPSAFKRLAPALRNDPIFNVRQRLIKDYQFVLNPSPEVVSARDRLNTEFMAAS
jgi:spermidine/putrescine transport system substrate-binding protein